MAVYTLYDPATGRIVQAGTCVDADLHLQGRPGFDRLDCASWPDDDYVDLSGPHPVVRSRPVLGLPDSLTLTVGQAYALTLSWPGTLTLDGQQFALPAGEHSLSADRPGTYQVEVEAWPARSHRMSVEVVA